MVILIVPELMILINHIDGTQTLRASCTSCLRGEEFFIFIEADKNLTELIIFNRLDEIRKDIMNLNILSESMQVIKITMSFGFNFQSFSGEEIVEKGVKLSDDFLYYSKENGRNKVSFNGNVKEGEAA